MRPQTVVVGAVFALLVDVAISQTARYGYNLVQCPSGSDTHLTVPIQQTPVLFQSRVSRVTPSPGFVTISSVLAPGWGTRTLGADYYVRWLSGQNEGRWSAIQSNTRESITLATAGVQVSSFQAGDRFCVVPYWTLDTLFPPGSQQTIHVSEGLLPHQHRSLVLLNSNAGSGINRSASSVFLLTGTGWVSASSGNTVAGTQRLVPGSTFVVRHSRNVLATSFLPSGRVVSGPDAVRIEPDLAGRKDINVGLQRSVPMTLGASALGSSAFAASLNHSQGFRGDELLVFDNASTAFNKAPSSTYYMVGTFWYRDSGLNASNPRAENESVFLPGRGVIIRKAAGTEAKFWTTP
jgi:uncharacterized protein (TIGR02597 family)